MIRKLPCKTPNERTVCWTVVEGDRQQGNCTSLHAAMSILRWRETPCSATKGMLRYESMCNTALVPPSSARNAHTTHSTTWERKRCKETFLPGSRHRAFRPAAASASAGTFASLGTTGAIATEESCYKGRTLGGLLSEDFIPQRPVAVRTAWSPTQPDVSVPKLQSNWDSPFVV